MLSAFGALVGRVRAAAMSVARRDAGLLALLAARVLQLGGAFAVSVCIVWRYGLPSAGLYAVAALPATLGALAVGFGLPNSLPRAAVGDGAKATLGLGISTALAVPVGLAGLAYAACLGRDAGEVTSIAALALAGALLGQVNVLQTLYVLHRRPILAPIAPALHLAGIGLAATCPTFVGFSLALLATRAAGCAVGFAPLAFGRVRLSDLGTAARDGSRFAPIDLACLLSEQLPVLVLNGYLGRAELGLYGLVRQFVAVADTPGWSYVLSRYPALVADPASMSGEVARGNARLGWASGLATLAVAAAMAVLVYRLPALLPLLPLALFPVPLRYLNNLCDQALRAAGHVRDCMYLAVGKIVLSLALFWPLAYNLGLYGAVLALSLLSVVSGLAYRQVLVARIPGALRPPRPAAVLTGTTP